MQWTTMTIAGVGVVVAIGLLMKVSNAKETEPMNQSPTVSVKVFDQSGTLVGPITMPRVVKTDAEWKAQLGAEAYQVTRHEGTERPGSCALLQNHESGIYSCASCGLPLFRAEKKFESGTGWPSFFAPIAKENVVDRVDGSFGMERTENRCARCDAHLGHVFNDGPAPTGLRYCMNGVALKFTPDKDIKTLADSAATTQPVK